MDGLASMALGCLDLLGLRMKDWSNFIVVACANPDADKAGAAERERPLIPWFRDPVDVLDESAWMVATISSARWIHRSS